MRFVNARTIELRRLVNKEYVKVSDVKGVIFPAGGEDVMLTEGNASKMYKFYGDKKLDLKEGDRLVSLGKIYDVKSVKNIDFRAMSRVQAVIYLMSE